MAGIPKEEEHLFRRQCEVLGLDFDEEMAEMAREAEEANKSKKQ